MTPIQHSKSRWLSIRQISEQQNGVAGRIGGEVCLDKLTSQISYLLTTRQLQVKQPTSELTRQTRHNLLQQETRSDKYLGHQFSTLHRWLEEHVLHVSGEPWRNVSEIVVDPNTYQRILRPYVRRKSISIQGTIGEGFVEPRPAHQSQPRTPLTIQPSAVYLASKTQVWIFPGFDLSSFFSALGRKGITFAGDSPPSSKSTGFPSPIASQASTSNGSRKRCHTTDFNLDNSASKPQGSKRRMIIISKPGSTSQPWYGCPFPKNNPGRYLPSVTACTKPPGFKEIKRVKYVMLHLIDLYLHALTPYTEDTSIVSIMQQSNAFSAASYGPIPKTSSSNSTRTLTVVNAQELNCVLLNQNGQQLGNSRP